MLYKRLTSILLALSLGAASSFSQPVWHRAHKPTLEEALDDLQVRLTKKVYPTGSELYQVLSSAFKANKMTADIFLGCDEGRYVRTTRIPDYPLRGLDWFTEVKDYKDIKETAEGFYRSFTGKDIPASLVVKILDTPSFLKYGKDIDAKIEANGFCSAILYTDGRLDPIITLRRYPILITPDGRRPVPLNKLNALIWLSHEFGHMSCSNPSVLLNEVYSRCWFYSVVDYVRIQEPKLRKHFILNFVEGMNPARRIYDGSYRHFQEELGYDNPTSFERLKILQRIMDTISITKEKDFMEMIRE